MLVGFSVSSEPELIRLRLCEGVVDDKSGVYLSLMKDLFNQLKSDVYSSSGKRELTKYNKRERENNNILGMKLLMNYTMK